MVIGAGGASRAAIYALLVYLGCSDVYLVNRDTSKAKQLVADMIQGGFAQCQNSVKVIE